MYGIPTLGIPTMSRVPYVQSTDIVGIPYVRILCVLYGIPTIGSSCGIILNWGVVYFCLG